MKKILIFLPTIFALYVVLNFFASNPSLISIISFADAAATISAIAITAQYISWVYLRDKTKAAISTVFFLIIFFSYNFIEQTICSFTSVLDIDKSFNIGLVSVFTILLLVTVYYCMKKNKSELSALSIFLVVFVTILPIMPIGTIIRYNCIIHDLSNSYSAEAGQKVQQTDIQLPDIYHIVLDGYGRDDVLRDYYNYDNSEMIDYLKSIGFAVRDDCHTNYVWTVFSVASMLSMDYIPDMNLDSELSRQMLMNQLKDNGVGELLGHHGYEYYEIASPVPTTKSSDFMNVYKMLNNTTKYILFETPFRYYFISNISQNDIEMYDYWRDKLIDTFESIPNIQNHSKPVYIYCHICMPHPPFVFTATGDPINPPGPFSINDCSYWVSQENSQTEYRKLYVQQLSFANLMVRNTIENIIQKDPNPTLIIVSSDHGPRLLIDQTALEKSQFHEALPIFLAYRLPEGDTLDLNNVKSPINLYRTILNHYCGTDYEMLDDQFYYTTWPGRIKITDLSYLLQTSEY